SGENLTASAERDASIAALREAVDAGLPASLADLSDLVRIPSVSWSAFDQEQVSRSAEVVAELARGLHVFDKVTVERAQIGEEDGLGQPAVLATRVARNGRPT